MKLLKQILNTTLILGFVALFSTQINAQCETWNDSPKKEYLEEQHVLYRQYVKQEQFEEAFPYWKNVFEMAPAADGQRPFHYMDGRAIYMNKFKNETDEAKKKEYAEMVLKLYDQQNECYPDDKATTLGLKAYDMFYELRTPYSKLLTVLEEAVEAGGIENTSYVVFQPYATLVVYEYTNERMDAAKAREVYTKLNEIADYGIANNEKYGTYYQQGKDAMNGTFAQIESNIFDCEYFKNKLEPEYRANPDDFELIKKIYNRLAAQGCEDSDPLVAELKAKYDKLVTEINAGKLKEFYKENPGKHARALYDEEKYDEAIAKYNEAIEKAAKEPGSIEQNDLANYHFEKASILFRKQKRYGPARESARKAASLKSGWGRPYMLIGDMYASTSSSCGKDAWDKQMAVLAAIEKYAYAKSIDNEVASEANKKIGKYNGFKPAKEDGFMRKVSAGDTYKVKCWIGEKVRVSFQ